jgi:hypothetical protein
MNRRNFLKASALSVPFVTTLHPSCISKTNPPASTIRDRFWIWSHMEGAYNGQWGLPKDSRITPVEGATYMGIPNIILVRYEDKPAPPFFQYSVPFKAMKNVFWSITGASGITSDEERKHVFELAAGMPNLTGFMMDDFFHGDSGASLSIEQLKDIRGQLTINGIPRKICVTLYTHQLFPQFKEHLSLCDVISLWTWKSEDLKDLEANFAKTKELCPTQDIFLGCYMWDFGVNQPIPIDRMKRQCELGLNWLNKGDIQGMIFLATNICDLDLETVEWSRQWIKDVGQEKL